jgi:hypothetical protein
MGKCFSQNHSSNQISPNHSYQVDNQVNHENDNWYLGNLPKSYNSGYTSSLETINEIESLKIKSIHPIPSAILLKRQDSNKRPLRRTQSF